MIYEWDPRQATENLKKHKVSFNEAAGGQKPMTTKNLASHVAHELLGPLRSAN